MKMLSAKWLPFCLGLKVLNMYTVVFCFTQHHDVIKWKHFPRCWPFVQGIHWSPLNSPHKCQWCGAFMFSLICTLINGWVNNGEAGDLRRHWAHYDVTIMGYIIVHRGSMSLIYSWCFLLVYYDAWVYIGCPGRCHPWCTIKENPNYKLITLLIVNRFLPLKFTSK